MSALEKIKKVVDKALPKRAGVSVSTNRGLETYLEWEKQQQRIELSNRPGHIRKAEDREPAGILAAERGR